MATQQWLVEPEKKRGGWLGGFLFYGMCVSVAVAVITMTGLTVGERMGYQLPHVALPPAATAQPASAPRTSQDAPPAPRVQSAPIAAPAPPLPTAQVVQPTPVTIVQPAAAPLRFAPGSEITPVPALVMPTPLSEGKDYTIVDDQCVTATRVGTDKVYKFCAQHPLSQGELKSMADLLRTGRIAGEEVRP